MGGRRNDGCGDMGEKGWKRGCEEKWNVRGAFGVRKQRMERDDDRIEEICKPLPPPPPTTYNLLPHDTFAPARTTSAQTQPPLQRVSHDVHIHPQP